MLMRLASMIVVLAAVGVCLVQFRRAETRAHYQAQQLDARLEKLCRQLGNQQVSLAEVTTQRANRERVEQMALGLREPTGRRPALAVRYGLPHREGQ